jgi:hypothetical protein
MRAFAKAYPEEPFVQEVLAQIPRFHHCLTQGGHDYPVFVGLECPVAVLQCQRLSKRQHFFVILLLLFPGHSLPRYPALSGFPLVQAAGYSLFFH